MRELEEDKGRNYKNTTDLHTNQPEFEQGINLFPQTMAETEGDFLITKSEKSNMMLYMELIWNLFYWVTFVMCWAVLPFLSEYVTAGEFTTKGKVMRSIINNLIFYAIAGFFFLIFMGYLYMKDAFKDITLKGFIIALANAWGLFLIIIFMSHGLVSVPKLFF
jgi:hypothetical protein